MPWKYPNNNWFKKEFVGQNTNKWIYPIPNERSSDSLVPIFVLAGGVNASAGVLFTIHLLGQLKIHVKVYTRQ